jgi:DNA end-binding protein Ku
LITPKIRASTHENAGASYEVRKEDEYFADIPDVKISSEMLKLAEHIVETKATEFDPSEFVDHYETAVVDLLKSKQAGAPRSAKPAAKAPSNVVNLMDALKRSLQEGKKGKSKSPSIVPAMPKAKKKARA